MPDPTPSEIVPHDPHGGTVSFLPSEHVAARVWRLAERIARTEFVPGSLRGKPDAILAAMLTGREVGIGAMHSLRAIDVIDGRPSLSPELLHALTLRAGHDLDVEESTRSSCTVAVRRHDWPEDRVRRITFDEVDARLAGLVGPDCQPAEGRHEFTQTTQSGKPTCGCRQGYRTYPRAMYRARAIAEAARTHLPDVVERIGYTAEEFGGQDPSHADAVETVRQIAGDDVAAEVDQALAEDNDPDGGTPAEPDPAPEPDTDGDAAEPAQDDDVVDAEIVEDDAPAGEAPAEEAPEHLAYACPRCDDGEVGPRDDGHHGCVACGWTNAPNPLAETDVAVEEPEAFDPDALPFEGPGVGDLDRMLAGSVPEVVIEANRLRLDSSLVWAAEVDLAAREGRDPRVTLRRSLGVPQDGQGAAEGPAEGGDTGQAGSDAPAGSSAHVPDDLPAHEVEYRRTVLKRYRTVYREVYDADRTAAGRLHALRLETVGGDDGGALWVDRADVERLEQGIARIAGEVSA